MNIDNAVVTEQKPWWKSKTLIINLISAALVSLEAGTGMLQPYLPMNFYAVFAVGLPVINSILRVVTTQALVMK